MNNNEIKLNFYDEEVKIKLPKKFSDFKNEIANKYSIESSDADELIIYYFDLSKTKFFIKYEKDYSELISATKQFQITVFLEIHEESKLYKRENNLSNNDKINLNKIDNSNSVADAEKLRKEILEKEQMLKAIIEKEKLEIQRKKEEAKKKAELDSVKKRLEEFKLKKAQLEKEEELRKLREKAELESEVSKLILENFDRLKESLIKDTVNESLNIVDKQYEKRSQYSSIYKCIHSNVECSSCGIKPIIGQRYMCPINNEINFCESCESFIGDEYDMPLLKIVNKKQLENFSNYKIVYKNNSNNGNNKDINNLKNINKDNLITLEDLMKKVNDKNKK